MIESCNTLRFCLTIAVGFFIVSIMKPINEFQFINWQHPVTYLMLLSNILQIVIELKCKYICEKLAEMN